MRKSSIPMDSDSDDESSNNNQRISEIIAKAKEKQKPILREMINPNIEDDIRKNYRRSIVRRAVQANVVTSTPSASAAAHSYLNLSSILHLESDGEGKNEKNEPSSSKTGTARKMSEGTEKPNEKKTEVVNVGGLESVDNFKKPPPCSADRWSTSGVNKKAKTKSKENNATLEKSLRLQPSSEVTDLVLAETSLRRKTGESSSSSGILLDYKSSPARPQGTSNQIIKHFEAEDNRLNNEIIENRGGNGVPISSSRSKSTMFTRGEDRGIERNEVDLEECNSFEVDDVEHACQEKTIFPGESRREVTEQSKKIDKQIQLRNTFESPIPPKISQKINKSRYNKNLNNSTGESKDPVRNSTWPNPNNKLNKFNVKGKNIVRDRGSKYQDPSDISESSSITEELCNKKLKRNTYHLMKKSQPNPNKENTRKKRKGKGYVDCSSDRSSQRKRKGKYRNLHNNSADSIASTSYFTKHKYRKVPVNLNDKENVKGRASKFHSDISVSSSSEKYNIRSHKKEEQSMADLKRDKLISKRQYKANIVDTSDDERKTCGKNRKSNVFHYTKYLPKCKHRSCLSISSPSSSVEYDQSCFRQDSSADSSVEYNKKYIHSRKSKPKENYRNFKCHRYIKNKYSNECRGNSIPRKYSLGPSKYPYSKKKYISDFEEEDDNDETITNNHDKYSKISKVNKNEPKMKQDITSAKEYQNYRKSKKELKNNVLSDNNISNKPNIPYVPKQSLQVILNSLVKKSLLQKYDSENVMGEITSNEAPIKIREKPLEQNIEVLRRTTHCLAQNIGNGPIENYRDCSSVSNTFLQDGSNSYSSNLVSFGNSGTPSIVINKESSFPKTNLGRQFARKPFNILDNNQISSTTEFSGFVSFLTPFCFFKKKGISTNKKRKGMNKCDAVFRKSTEFSDPVRNWNFRKPLSTSERIAMKANLDQVLGLITAENLVLTENNANAENIPVQNEPSLVDAETQVSWRSQECSRINRSNDPINEKPSQSIKNSSLNEISLRKNSKLSVANKYSCHVLITAKDLIGNDANEEKILALDEPSLVNAATQVSRLSQKSSGISKINDPMNEKPSQSIEISSPNEISLRKNSKLSVATQYSPHVLITAEKLVPTENNANEENIPVQDEPSLVDAETQVSRRSQECSRINRSNDLINEKPSQSIKNSSLNEISLRKNSKLSVAAKNSPYVLLTAKDTVLIGNDANEEKVLALDERNLVNAATQVPRLSQKSSGISKMNDPMNEKPSQSIEISSPNEMSLRKNSKLSVATKYSHHALINAEDIGLTENNAYEENILVQDEPSLLDAPTQASRHSRESSKISKINDSINDRRSQSIKVNSNEIFLRKNSKLNVATKYSPYVLITSEDIRLASIKYNTLFNTSHSDVNKSIKRRMKLECDKESTVNKESDLSQPIFKNDNPTSHIEISKSTDTLNNDLWTNSAGFTRNVNVDTTNNRPKINVIQNITLQNRESISSAPSTSQIRPPMTEESTKIQKKKQSSKGLKKSKKGNSNQEKENIIQNELSSVRKSSRNRRPPQTIWWKSTIAEKETNLLQYYQSSQYRKHERKGNCGNENSRSSELRTKDTDLKMQKRLKNNNKRDNSTEPVPVPKNKKTKKVATKSDSHNEKSSKEKGKDITSADDYPTNSTSRCESRHDISIKPANNVSPSENFVDHGYVTSSTSTEQDSVFKKLYANLNMHNVSKTIDENIVYLNIGQAMSLGNHFGYLILAPGQMKKAINFEYDMVYCIIEGTCTICRGSEIVIKGPREFSNIDQGTPYLIENNGPKPLLLNFMCFRSYNDT